MSRVCHQAQVENKVNGFVCLHSKLQVVTKQTLCCTTEPPAVAAVQHQSPDAAQLPVEGTKT